MALEFNPNAKPAPELKWATYIPDRSTGPKFKIHKNLGHAKNAFHYKSDAIMYELVDGEWVERFRVEGKRYERQCPHDGCSGTTRDWKWAKGKELKYEPEPCYYCRYPSYTRGGRTRPDTGCTECPAEALQRRHDD